MKAEKSYMNRLRVRSSGLLVENNSLLLVEVLSPITNLWTWIPPGGGVEFGETLEEAAQREFLEETGLKVSVSSRIHFDQIIEPPIHAIEFYFVVQKQGGVLMPGFDPELPDEDQILRNAGFFSKEEIQEMNVSPGFLKKDFWETLAS